MADAVLQMPATANNAGVQIDEHRQCDAQRTNGLANVFVGGGGGGHGVGGVFNRFLVFAKSLSQHSALHT